MQILTLPYIVYVNTVWLIQTHALIIIVRLCSSQRALKEVQSVSLLLWLLLWPILLSSFLFWLWGLLGSYCCDHVLLFLLLHRIFLIEPLAWANHPSDLCVAFYLWGMIGWDSANHLVIHPHFVQIQGIILLFNYWSLIFLVLWLVFLSGVLFHWWLGRYNHVLRHYVGLRRVIAGK